MEIKMLKALFANIPKDLVVVAEENQFNVIQYAKQNGYKTRETYTNIPATMRGLSANEILIIPNVPMSYRAVIETLYEKDANVAILSPIITFFGEFKQRVYRMRKVDFIFLSDHVDRQHRVFNLKETGNILGVVWVLAIRGKTDNRVVFQEVE